MPAKRKNVGEGRRAWELKKIDEVSAGKISALLFFVGALFYALLAAAWPGFWMGKFGMAGMMNYAMGFAYGYSATWIFLLLVYGLVYGFVVGIISAWLYNVFASRVGGIKMEFK